MAIKKREAPSGAPDWIVTYGDMMSLLLCFFIMLAALANYDKQDKRLMTAIESIREALGTPGQVGWLPADEIDLNSLHQQLIEVVHLTNRNNRARADAEGLEGPDAAVRNIRDGVEFVVGGPVAFTRFSAELRPEAEPLLAGFAERVRGFRNKLEIRGHATREPLPADAPFSSDMALAFARGEAVRLKLIELGIAPERIRVSAAGAYEPLVRPAYGEGQLAQNRRVEIRVYDTCVEDFEDPEPRLDASGAEG
ncbi:MAG TPA: flagellar motor protein MotB [Phycisphaerae bacterium]|jgi:chemotaxis protein MotB|nr:OmpA family protein [Phycisphaerae bacterium]HPM22573.1 flagellar motor protein MotB [Phycisphaerae bacterium]HQL53465.1 flagellar motor protein MotB [Phycisphaerae bacterium]